MGRRLHVLERIAWGVGLALIAIYLGARAHSFLMRRADLADFEKASASMALASARADTTSGPNELAASTPTPGPESEGAGAGAKLPDALYGLDTTLWAEKRIAKYEESLEVDMGLPLGILRIPKIRLEVPIRTGTDELVLNRAVGHIVGTALPDGDGNLGIAGHRDGYFRGLKDIVPGDTLEVQTLAQTRTYRIDEIVIVQPEDVWVLDPTPEPSVTLVTCYPFYFMGSAPQRYIVKATLLDSGG